MRKQSSTRQAFAGLAVVPVLLVSISLWSRAQYKDRLGLVNHTRSVLVAIDKLVLGMTRAETEERGFLITGDPHYLADFQTVRARVPEDIAALRHLVSDNPVQIANLDRLQQLAQARIAELDRAIALRSAAGLEPAVAAVESNRGHALMERVTAASSGMSSEAERLLGLREKAQHLVDLQVDITLVAGVLGTLALLLWARAQLIRYAAERDRASAEVIELNRELELRVNERTAQLKRSNNDLQQFAYVASHDLQEPLRMIGSYVGLLERRYKGKLDKDADTYIHYAVDGAKRMQLLINDLLTYSRAGTQELNLEPTSTRQVLDDVLLNLQTAIGESQARIEAGRMPELMADRIKLTLVFQNLIANSLRFRDPGRPPHIRIAAERVEQSWRFSLADNGIGFDPRYAERIFVIFQRLHGGGKYPGTGMGLAIVKRIVEGHGGAISVESGLGHGSTFYFTLPARAGAGIAAANKVQAGGSPG